MVVCGDLWWFAVVCGGLWWFVVVCGGLSFSHTREKTGVSPDSRQLPCFFGFSICCMQFNFTVTPV